MTAAKDIPDIQAPNRWRYWIYFAVLALLLAVAVPAALYVSVPVQYLRGVVTYKNPYLHDRTQVGLGIEDNLTMRYMSVDLILATLVGEDYEFATERGVRPAKMWELYQRYLDRGGHLYGGSTLSQQIAKNLYTDASTTLWRKFSEIIYAIKMERYFNKDEIFTLYANMAQTGPHFYGYRKAAKTYFDKKPWQLTISEASFIVFALPNPTKRTKWFREGKRIPLLYDRLHYIVSRTLQLHAARIPFGHLTGEQKEHFFTDYMKNPNFPVCLTEPKILELQAKAGRITAAFIRKHTHDTPAAHDSENAGPIKPPLQNWPSPLRTP